MFFTFLRLFIKGFYSLFVFIRIITIYNNANKADKLTLNSSPSPPSSRVIVKLKRGICKYGKNIAMAIYKLLVSEIISLPQNCLYQRTLNVRLVPDVTNLKKFGKNRILVGTIQQSIGITGVNYSRSYARRDSEMMRIKMGGKKIHFPRYNLHLHNNGFNNILIRQTNAITPRLKIVRIDKLCIWFILMIYRLVIIKHVYLFLIS